MLYPADLQCSAFLDSTCLASGTLAQVAQQVKSLLGDDAITATIINNHTSDVIEVDFRGDLAQVASQFELAPKQPETHSNEGESKGRRGRPKLGVVAKEITLLPKHWEWLQKQPGGASATLRKLVMEAQKGSERFDKQRAAQNTVYKFMTIFASGQPDYEEALRALYADNPETFESLISVWPEDIQRHLGKIAPPAFSPRGNSPC